MIYLDSAATTLQKPPEVYQAVQDAMLRMSSPGRGGHAAARLAEQTVFACRQCAAELFDVDSPEQVVFTMNATHALNLAIKSVVPVGGTVVLSGYEHNAVTRPLHRLGARLRVAAAAPFDTQGILRAFAREIGAGGVHAVICNQVSNVFGFALPVEEIAQLCRRERIALIVDASQAAGTHPISLRRWQASYVAMAGHKGLYGPQGTGLLLCGKGQMPESLLEGGTGSLSREQEMPDFLPDRLEAGTPNVAGIAGLLAGMRFVRRYGAERIGRHEQILIEQAAEGLERLPWVECFLPQQPKDLGAVLSFRCRRRSVEEVAEALAERDIAVRSGLHCAPLAHRSAGTLQTGTVRLSTSAWNRPEEIGKFLEQLRRLDG